MCGLVLGNTVLLHSGSGDLGLGRIYTGIDFDGVGGLGHVSALVLDRYRVGSVSVGCVHNAVRSVTVIGGLRGNFALGSTDFDFELITALLETFVESILSLDGEGCGLVHYNSPASFYTWSVHFAPAVVQCVLQLGLFRFPFLEQSDVRHDGQLIDLRVSHVFSGEDGWDVHGLLGGLGTSLGVF